jgi:Trk-type K+ transport system membrane component
MSLLGLDMFSAFGAVAGTLGNVDPSLASVGPTDNYAHLPAVGKWLISLFMLLGRVGIFIVIVLFHQTPGANNRSVAHGISYANTSGISSPRRIADGLQRDDAGTRHSFFFLRRRGQ